MGRIAPIGTNAVIAALSMPTTNWGQLMAAKDQQLRYQAVQSQEVEQEALKEQQAAAQIAQFKQKIRALPLERPDKERVSRWLMGQEKETARRLQQYEGNLTKFMAAEGPQWMEQTLTALEGSDEYKTGVSNLEQILQAKEALKKGESLVGEVREVNGVKQYVPATQKLQDYYAGRSPKFTFSGSYKDDNDLVKHFGEQYPAGKLPFEQTPVSESDKLNYLLSTNTPDIAMDKYLSKYKNAQVFYKTKPLDDYQDFQNKQTEFSRKQEDRQIDRQLDQARFDGINLSNAIKKNKLQKQAGGDGDGNDPGAYLRKMIPQSAAEPGSAYVEDAELEPHKVLRHSGYDLRAFGGKANGKAAFNALPVLDKQAIEALGTLVGAEKTKDGWRGGKILEGIVDKNGFNGIDLSSAKHQITHIDPKIYTNPREFGPSGQPISPNGPTGFLKVTVKFDDNSEAKKAGLLEGLFKSATRVGAGAYNDDTHEITLYTPIGSIYKNAALNRYLSNQDAGAKVTNDFMNAYTLGTDDD